MAQTSYLNLMVKATAYNDQLGNSNPNRRFFDWGRSFQGVQVSNPKTISYTLAPNSSQSVFSGVDTTSIDNTTQFTLAVSTLSTNKYRFTATAGTLPALRTDRGLTPNGHTYTLVSNNNSTLSLTSSVTGEFASVQAGDNLWIPGPTTGDSATVFNTLNEGLWTVLALDGTSTTLQLARLADYSGVSEVVASTANTQIVIFSASGVQIGDTVDISAGFATAVQKAYQIQMVTPTWFEVNTTSALPVSQVAIPGVNGIVFYSTAKRLVGIETDQELIVRRNGDTTSLSRLSPVVAGDQENTGFQWVWGPTWSLTIINKSSVPCNVTILTAE